MTRRDLVAALHVLDKLPEASPVRRELEMMVLRWLGALHSARENAWRYERLRVPRG